jgi:hypothetical protein
MKQVIILFLILFGFNFQGKSQAAVDQTKKVGDQKSSSSFQLSVQSSDPSAIHAIVSALENQPKSVSIANNGLSTNKTDSINKACCTMHCNDTVIVDKVYHISFFKPRIGSAAVGFENYFRIKDFGNLKKNYLDQSAGDKGKLVLFVNGKPFPGVKLRLFDESKGTISFLWMRDDSLTKVFSQSFISKCSFRINNATLGFGYYDQQSKKWVQVGNQTIKTLYVIKRYAIAMVVVWSALLIFCVYYFGRKTNLLRSGVDNSSPFSLALTQFAFWTVIIFTSYFYLWIVSFELVAIPDSTLALLGITAMTTAGSRVVDIRRAYVPGRKSQGFITDLLSEDEVGLSIHRCQLFLITLLFGGIYIFDVLRTQSLPDFNNSLLWLIGISSGTFIGIKSVEGKTPTPPAANPATTGQVNPTPPANAGTTSPVKS